MIVEVTEESELKELQDVLIEFYKIMPYKQLCKESEEGKKACEAWIESWYFMVQSQSASILGLKQNNKFNIIMIIRSYIIK